MIFDLHENPQGQEEDMTVVSERNVKMLNSLQTDDGVDGRKVSSYQKIQLRYTMNTIASPYLIKHTLPQWRFNIVRYNSQDSGKKKHVNNSLRKDKKKQIQQKNNYSKNITAYNIKSSCLDNFI